MTHHHTPRDIHEPAHRRDGFKAGIVLALSFLATYGQLFYMLTTI